MILIELPIPKSVNHLLRSGGRGRKRFYPDEVRAYFDEWIPKVRTMISENYGLSQICPIDHDVYLTFIFYFNDNRRRDVFNLMKVPCDVLERGGFVTDDKFIVGEVIRVIDKGENPRVAILWRGGFMADYEQRDYVRAVMSAEKPRRSMTNEILCSARA